MPLKKKPTEYLKQLYYDSIVFTPEALKTLIAEVGVDQIMMGTDYPFPWTQHVGRPHPQHAGAERRRPNRDARRYRGAAARHQTELVAAPNEYGACQLEKRTCAVMRLTNELYTLTSGTFGTVPPRGGPPPSPSSFGPGGFLRTPGLRGLRARFSGIFSGFGVTGPSRNSKPSLLLPSSSLISDDARRGRRP